MSFWTGLTPVLYTIEVVVALRPQLVYYQGAHYTCFTVKRKVNEQSMGVYILKYPVGCFGYFVDASEVVLKETSKPNRHRGCYCTKPAWSYTASAPSAAWKQKCAYAAGQHL